MPESTSPPVRYVDHTPADARAATFSSAERAILDTINTRIGGRESLGDIVRLLAEMLQPVSPCDRFSVALLDDSGGRVISHATRAFYEPLKLKSGYAEDLQGSSLAQVIDRGTPRIIDDLEAYQAAHPDSRSTQLLVKEGVRSSLTCPLEVEGRNVGLLFRSSRQSHAYDDHQVLLHLATADRLSQAVEKAWRIERLTEAKRAYFELLGFVAHELKSPVSSMLMEAGLLTQGYLGELNDEQRTHLDKLIRKGRYLLDLVSDYLDLSRIEGGQLEYNVRSDVDFAPDILDQVIEIVTPQADNRRMTVELDVPDPFPPVELDPKLIRIVLVNLLGNAVKYGYDGGRIRLRARLDHDKLKVAVWNAGPGFGAEQRSKLFRRFSRLDKKELLTQKGTGVGLYTSWRIVQLHGGRMDARSEEGQWAEFSFTIPQPLPTGTARDLR